MNSADVNLANDFVKARDLRQELRRLEESISRRANQTPITAADEQAMTAMQARADASYAAASRRAPPPLPLERPEAYRRRLLNDLRDYSPRWRAADVQSMPDDALSAVEPMIFADAIKHGRTHDLKPGEFRERVVPSEGGHRIIEFDAAEGAHFVDLFNRPARRAKFRPHSEYDQLSRDAQLARISEIARAPRIVEAPNRGLAFI
jgi:hypothetical protein